MELALVSWTATRTRSARAPRQDREGQGRRQEVPSRCQDQARHGLSLKSPRPSPSRSTSPSRPTSVEDGTEVQEHQRRLPEGHTERDNEEREDIIRELNEAREYQRNEEQRYGLDYVDGLSERVMRRVDDSTFRGRGGFLPPRELDRDGHRRGGGLLRQDRREVPVRAGAPSLSSGRSPASGWRSHLLPLRRLQRADEDRRRPGRHRDGRRPAEGRRAETTRKALVGTRKNRLPTTQADNARGRSRRPRASSSTRRQRDRPRGRAGQRPLPALQLPKHLRAMRKEEGVEYIRRRMFGGPTAEDLHAAMMMGVEGHRGLERRESSPSTSHSVHTGSRWSTCRSSRATRRSWTSGGTG
jgi:hypothetical protein